MGDPGKGMQVDTEVTPTESRDGAIGLRRTTDVLATSTPSDLSCQRKDIVAVT